MIDTTAVIPARTDIPPGLRVAVVGRDLWRVTDSGGRVRAHVRLVQAQGSPRYRVERYDTRAGGFRRIGEFWTPREAFDCVRFQR